MMELISAICLSHKGLTEPELIKFSKLTELEVKSVLGIFGMFFMNYKGYYMSHNEVFRNIVEKLYYPDAARKQELHRHIGLIFDKAPNNVRKLEEEATHFYRSEEFFSLKQSISTIENFLMLFNPITKFDLFRYWRRLEQRGYDPVIEYNKGVEQFDTQYIPEPDKLFVIILQVCRFLKEFSDFETEVTPIFRHPMIKGKVGVKLKQDKNRKNEEEMASSVEPKNKELLSRGNSLSMQKLPQNKSLSRDHSMKRGDPNTYSQSKIDQKKKSIISTETSRKRRRLDPLGTKEPFYNRDNELSDIDEPDNNLDKDGQRTFNYLEKIGLLKELRQFKLTKDLPTAAAEEKSVDHESKPTEKYSNTESRFAEILEEWEDVNVDNPRGRLRFREHFEKLIADRYHYKRNQGGDYADDAGLTDLNSDPTRSQKHLLSELRLIETEEDKKKHEYLEKIDDIDLEIKSEKIPSFYYYKRWIWIMFPWACMSIKKELNFSDVIAKCYSSATKYMRIEEENDFYRSALEIAIEYKLRKESILAKHVSNWENKDPEQEKLEKIKAMYEEYSKPPPPDHMRTFTNLVVKKEDPSKKRVVNTHHGSRRLLAPVAAKPAMWTQDAAAFKSATRLKQPHLRSTLAAKDSVFMTGVDASEAGNESKYPHIDSVAYQQSQLASDLEPRRVLVGQLHGMLRCINTKSQKSLAVLDSNIERQVELDVTILSKENDALAKELNELIFKK